MVKKKQIIIPLFVFLFLISNLYSQSADKRTIAVLDFDNNSIVQKQQLEPLRTGLADMLSTEISQIEAFKVVERKKLKDLLSEISLGQSGVLDPSTAQQVGKLLGAQTMLLGGFVNMFGGKMRIDVRIVEVETGVTLKAVEETGNVDNLFEMVKELAKDISDVFEVKLTDSDKQRLKQNRGSDNFEATLYFSKGIEFEDMARKALNAEEKEQAKELYQKAFESYKKAVQKSDEFNKAKQKMNEVESILNQI